MANNKKIDTKDIYNTYWRCRDFELSNLWQRSIFLTAFLVLCFTAYGAVLNKITDNISQDKVVILSILNSICYVISLLGIIFSNLWIKMSKGSKAWYEKYEQAIAAIEKSTDYATNKAVAIGGFSYGAINNYQNPVIDNSVMSGKGGAYSVSKINIAIGQIFFIVWITIGLIHACILSYTIHGYSTSNYYGCIVLFTCIALLALVSILFARSRMFASSSI